MQSLLRQLCIAEASNFNSGRLGVFHQSSVVEHNNSLDKNEIPSQTMRYPNTLVCNFIQRKCILRVSIGTCIIFCCMLLLLFQNHFCGIFQVNYKTYMHITNTSIANLKDINDILKIENSIAPRCIGGT